MGTREQIAQKKKEIEELKRQFLKDNVGNTFYISDTEFGDYIVNPFNGEKSHNIPSRYIYVYEENEEVLTKHILVDRVVRSDCSKFNGCWADWTSVINETVYKKVISGIKNFDYLDKIIENYPIVKKLPEEIEYLIENVKDYNLHNTSAFVVSESDSLNERLERIKYFIKKCG